MSPAEEDDLSPADERTMIRLFIYYLAMLAGSFLVGLIGTWALGLEWETFLP